MSIFTILFQFMPAPVAIALEAVLVVIVIVFVMRIVKAVLDSLPFV